MLHDVIIEQHPNPQMSGCETFIIVIIQHHKYRGKLLSDNGDAV